MTLNEQIMELQTYKMYEGEDTVYVERDEVLKLLEQQTCEDAISKHAVLETIDNRIEQIKRDADEINKSYSHLSFAEGVYDGYCRLKCDLWDLPSVTPKFTDTEIQKMQDLEQAQLDKAYGLGKAEVQPCEDCISRTEALKHSHIEYDDDGEGHRVIYAEDIKDLPSVTPKASED
jgi:hypothetical protein